MIFFFVCSEPTSFRENPQTITLDPQIDIRGLNNQQQSFRSANPNTYNQAQNFNTGFNQAQNFGGFQQRQQQAQRQQQPQQQQYRGAQTYRTIQTNNNNNQYYKQRY